MEKLEKLKEKFDQMQEIYGCKELNSVYGCGCDNSPEVALVFMNPTAKNIATAKDWQGLRAQWLGTKMVWQFLAKCGIFDSKLCEEIKGKKQADWTPEFCERVYEEVANRGVWITNLAKCTQVDARELPNFVFQQYRKLLEEELKIVNPKKIIFFGNQVASIMLEQNISVSASRLQKFWLKIADKSFECYAVYYPVGNGRFNQPKAIEDVRAIMGK